MTENAKTILVVDDDPDTRTYLTTVLEDNGFATISAKDGTDALESVQQKLPDLIQKVRELAGRVERLSEAQNSETTSTDD